eukprot:CAMPEP_0172455520 /NCGR_PEP_ID=MMETSP1065-20121228/12109_1 /TAXON_ID=265537 /ORGANISM="Amphiprora paludosa, Strain CCMP125" /LENGTH=380 /DNA_ID=CAMNT_0013207981 /DNA_START=91 /DNA_END=1233 /DNA_ORIENTATION=+
MARAATIPLQRWMTTAHANWKRIRAVACFSSSAVHVDTFHQKAASSTVDLDKTSTTELVDQLLAYTRQLMNSSTSTIPDATNIPKQHIIAFSGGVDSSLVAALVHQSQLEGEQVRAVLGLSPAVPQEQLDLAQHAAESIGVPLSLIRTTEGEDDMYIENAGQACLACKTNLYSSLQAVVDHVNQEEERLSISATSPPNDNPSTFHLYNGTNADDLKDPTRLGLIAAQNFSVRSPLQHIPKDKVRAAAKHLGLSNWNYAASPCLRSRLALGVPATAQHLKRVEEAERFVRQELRHILDETSNLRVRLLAQNRARIELDGAHVPQAEAVDWNEKFVQELGFSSVLIQAFRSGSVATNNKNGVSNTSVSGGKAGFVRAETSFG